MQSKKVRVPQDAPYPPENDMVGFMAKAVSMDFVEELATGMLAKHVLFVFDSCFSGTLLRGTAHPEPITEKTTRKVRQFITSGSANEQVPDESVFKASFLNALDGGTALNLGFGAPRRLSVDLDFNYIGALDRDQNRENL